MLKKLNIVSSTWSLLQGNTSDGGEPLQVKLTVKGKGDEMLLYNTTIELIGDKPLIEQIIELLKDNGYEMY